MAGDEKIKAKIKEIKDAYGANAGNSKSPLTAAGFVNMWIDVEQGTKTKIRVPARIILIFGFSDDKSNPNAKAAVFGKKKASSTTNVRDQQSDLTVLTKGQAIGKQIIIPLPAPIKGKRGTKEVTYTQTSLRVPQIASRDAISLFLKLNCEDKKVPAYWFTQGKKSEVSIPAKLDFAALGNIKSIKAQGETTKP